MVSIGVGMAATGGFFDTPVSGGTFTYVTVGGKANANGTVSTFNADIRNSTGQPVYIQWVIFACTDLGNNSYSLAQRSASSEVTVDNGFTGVKTLQNQSCEVHIGDVIGLRVRFPVASFSGNGFLMYVSGLYAAGKFNIRRESAFSSGTFTIYNDEMPYALLGDGSDYSGGTGGTGGGGVGGAPKDQCHTSEETVYEGMTSSSLWGVIKPYQFGLSGGKNAAFCSITYPWEQYGYYHDEILMDGETETVTNPANPMEHYTISCTVFRSEGANSIYNIRECWWMEPSNGDVYVDPIYGSDSNLGINWLSPYKNLWTGINEVKYGGVIHCKCSDNVQYVGDIAKNLIIKPYVNGSYTRIYMQ